jgi:Spy/CpxP family protein refolding chaperone
MKKAISILLFASALLINLNVQAQKPDRLPRLHDRIQQAKMREFRIKLKLDEAAYQQFRPIYQKYDWAISKLDFRKMTRLMQVKPDSLSSEEADQLITDQLQIARKLIDIRQKYYKEFRTVLTPQQILLLYQMEAEMRKKVMNEMKRRMISR